MKTNFFFWLILAGSSLCSCEYRKFSPGTQRSSAWQSVETVFSAARTERICENYKTQVFNQENHKKLAWCFTARLNATFRDYFRLEKQYLKRTRADKRRLELGLLDPESEEHTLEFNSRFTMFKALDLLARRSSMSIGGYSIYIVEATPSVMRFQIKAVQGSRNPEDGRHLDEAVLIPEDGAWRIDAITYVWKGSDSSGKPRTYKESLDGRLNYGITLLNKAIMGPATN